MVSCSKIKQREIQNKMEIPNLQVTTKQNHLYLQDICPTTQNGDCSGVRFWKASSLWDQYSHKLATLPLGIIGIQVVVLKATQQKQ